MTNRPSTSAAHNAWLDAMLTDLQRQIDKLVDQVDDLGGQLHALARQVHSHTSTALTGSPAGEHDPATLVREG